jgi:glycosyltransferase involved in cell wall biosynthesis
MQNEFRPFKDQIHFLEGVSDGQLKTLYPAASAFVTMSEHEGFCIPLVEAMVFDTPIFAYGCEAVVETLGQSGRVFYKKDFAALAANMHDVLTTDWKRAKILAEQRRRLAEITSCIDGRTIWSTIEEVFFRRDEINELASANQAGLPKFKTAGVNGAPRSAN